MELQFVSAHLFATFLHMACAVYAFATPHAYTTSIPSELARVTYEENEYYAKGDAIRFSIPSVILLHGIVAVVTCTFHACVYIPSHYLYGRVIWSQGFYPLRWLEYSITCTIMTISSVASAGTSDFTILLSTIFLGVGLQSLGAAIEQRKEWVYFLLFVGSTIGMGESTSTVWYLVSNTGLPAVQMLEFLSYVFYYGLFPLNCAFDALRRKGRFIETDWTYIVLSLSSKFGLFWLQVGEVERKETTGPWPDVQIYLLGIVCPLLILVSGIYLTPKHVEAAEASQGQTLLRKACTFRIVPPVVTETRVERRYISPRSGWIR